MPQKLFFTMETLPPHDDMFAAHFQDRAKQYNARLASMS